MLAGAGLVALLPAATDGPLGAWRLLGPRSHRGADWVVVAALALSPVVPGRSAVSILVLEVAAVLLARLVGFTRYPTPGRAAVGPTTSPAAGTTSPAAAESPASGPAGTASPGTAGPGPRPGAASPADRPAPTTGAPAPVDPQVELAVRRQARRVGLAVGILQRRAREARRQP